jgi:hypothetical protein
MTRFLVAVALLSLTGCGLVPSQASCDHRPKQQACTDLLTNRNNQFSSTLKVFCGDGTYSESLCNHTGALGGCKCDGCENGEAIDWFFPDADGGVTTEGDVKKKCESVSRPFVAP